MPDSAFAAYPLRPASYATTLGPTVVVVPHPDDEALGCGGLLALLRQAGVPVAAVLVSDGTMSHPHSQDFPAPARRELRYAEFRHALAVLGVDESDNNVLYLGLPDGHVPTPGQPGFAEATQHLADFLLEKQATTVLVPWRRDPHPDHRATSQLTAAALAQLPQPPRRLEYVVWAWERAAPADLPHPNEGTGFRLDITSVLSTKQRAIAAHRSQLAPGTIADDPSGFLLSADMLAHFAQPTESFIESNAMNQQQPNTLGPTYFDDVYRANDDPWAFASSAYERGKYAATLAALPRPHYARAFEIGCSIGVLTAQLAARCGSLLSVDVSEAALAQARQRCAGLPQVELRNMQVPNEFPAGNFDLILLSEVGYYWSPADLARAADQMLAALPPTGQLLLVHWTPVVPDYPQTGDEVHEFFLQKTQDGGPLRHLHGERSEKYRLDLFERNSERV